MSDVTPAGRDQSGRFRKTEREDALHAVDDGDMHPMAKLLFGWVSAGATGSFILWGVIILAIALVAADYMIGRAAPVNIVAFNGALGALGAGAVVIIALLAWLAGSLLRRSEDYYGEGDATPLDARQEAGE